jgi:hypothetical protein
MTANTQHRVSSHQGIFSAVFAMIYASWLAILRSVPTWLPDIKKYISFQWIYSLSLWLLPCRERQGYVTYKTAKDEEQYWRSAALHRRRLASSDARFADLKTKDEAIPLVMYYTPRLLPLYRTPRTLDAEANEYHLPARIFCKWHRMVFPGRVRACQSTECLVNSSQAMSITQQDTSKFAAGSQSDKATQQPGSARDISDFLYAIRQGCFPGPRTTDTKIPKDMGAVARYERS